MSYKSIYSTILIESAKIILNSKIFLNLNLVYLVGQSKLYIISLVSLKWKQTKKKKKIVVL